MEHPVVVLVGLILALIVIEVLAAYALSARITPFIIRLFNGREKYEEDIENADSLAEYVENLYEDYEDEIRWGGIISLCLVVLISTVVFFLAALEYKGSLWSLSFLGKYTGGLLFAHLVVIFLPELIKFCKHLMRD